VCVVDISQISAAEAVSYRALGSNLEHSSREPYRLEDSFYERLACQPVNPQDLNALLGASTVDLSEVCELVLRDPELASQIIEMVNCTLFGLRNRVTNLAEAAVLLGVERFRALVITCSVMTFSGRELDPAAMNRFWRHSCLVGLIAERAANWLGYASKDYVHLSGLMHDLGELPLYLAAQTKTSATGNPQAPDWIDHLAAERAEFGADHSQLGRWMGISFDFHPAFIDVLENHHAPQSATFDHRLVGVIAVADRFCVARGFAASITSSPTLSRALFFGADTRSFLPQLTPSEFDSLMELLESELIHLLPLIEPCTNPARDVLHNLSVQSI
jgi:HD-like signal output (HDOD) protein